MKKIFCFKLIILLSLIVVFIGIFSPLNVLALDEQYITSDQFDDEKAGEAKFEINGNTYGGSFTKASEFEVNSGNSVGDLIRKGLGIVLTIVRIITLGWAVIMAVSIAIKYMTGSPQIKSQLKTDMPTYVIGALLLFGASGLIRLIQVFTEDIVVVEE